MKTNYNELWKRVHKHLDNDIREAVYVLESENRIVTEEYVACIQSGMTNAYWACRYILLDVLTKNSIEIGMQDELHMLIECLLMSDVVELTKAEVEWAYDLADWEFAWIIDQDNNAPAICVTLDNLRNTEKQLVWLQQLCNRCVQEA